MKVTKGSDCYKNTPRWNKQEDWLQVVKYSSWAEPSNVTWIRSHFRHRRIMSQRWTICWTSLTTERHESQDQVHQSRNLMTQTLWIPLIIHDIDKKLECFNALYQQADMAFSTQKKARALAFPTNADMTALRHLVPYHWTTSCSILSNNIGSGTQNSIETKKSSFRKRTWIVVCWSR